MRPAIRLLVLLLVSGGLTACASTGASAGDSEARSRNVLTAEQLEATREHNAYLAVQKLRPLWLRKRGPRDMADLGDIKVYIERTLMGGPDALRQIPVGEVASIEFLNAMDAETWFGRGHENGAIVVRTR